MDHPAEIANYGDGGYKAVVVCIILILMQLALVSGRCFARRLQKVLLEADDYVLLLATVRPKKSWMWPLLTSSRCLLLVSAQSQSHVCFPAAMALLSSFTCLTVVLVPRIAAVGQGAQYSEDASQARLVGSVGTPLFFLEWSSC